MQNELTQRRHACTGRFLTMHKRRRKKLNTRGFATVPAILDDILHGHVRYILDHVGNWRFNAFILENVTGGGYSSLNLLLFFFDKYQLTIFWLSFF